MSDVAQKYTESFKKERGSVRGHSEVEKHKYTPNLLAYD